MHDLVPQRSPVLAVANPQRNWRSYDPFIRPEWRWDRVLKLLDQAEHPARVGRRDDSYIRGAKTFLAHWRKATDDYARDTLMRENPGMYWAYQIYDRANNLEPEVAFIIEAMLLANEPYDKIASATHTCPEAIDWYEAVFFNVVPRLDSWAWITKQVLLPAADRFAPAKADKDDNDDQHQRFVTQPVIKPHLDVTIKFFAYFGGPVMCDFVITGFRRGVLCRSQEEIATWLNDQWSHQMACRSAMAAGEFQVDKWSVEMLFATHARIIELQKNAQNQDERRTMMEKHVSMMMAELPWVHGDMAKDVFKNTDIGRYDNMAAELRDEELQLVASGENLAHLEELPLLAITKKPGKEAKHGNPK